MRRRFAWPYLYARPPGALLTEIRHVGSVVAPGMSWIARTRHHIRAALRALPLECAATAVAVVSLWVLVARRGTIIEPEPLAQVGLSARCFFAAIVAVPLLYSVTILRRAGRVSPRASYAMAAVAVAVAFGLGGTGLEHEAAFAWRFGLGLLAAVMVPFLAAAAAAPRGERTVGFADFVRRFSEETTSSGLLLGAALIATGVLVASLEGLFGMHRLFGMKLEDAWLDGVGLIAGMIALGYLHRLLPGEAQGRVPELWRRLIARVAAPFLVAMLGILVAYEAWVIVRGELPVNMVSPLIVAAGAIGFASTLVIESLVASRRERTLSPADPHPWTGAGPVRLSRAFAAVLLALLPLAMWALWVRIDQHGLTPMRVSRLYALGCLGLLALWGTARWIRRRGPLTWQIPALTAIAALLGAVGPLSAVNLSLDSQADRLSAALDRAGVSPREVRREPPGALREIDSEAFEEIGDRIEALAELGGAEALSRELGGDVQSCALPSVRHRCATLLGLTAPDRTREVGVVRSAYIVPGQVQQLGVTRAVELTLGDRTVSPVRLDAMSLTLRDNRLVADMGGGVTATADLSGSVQTWFDSQQLGTIPPLRDAAGCDHGHIFATRAEVERTADRPRLVFLHGIWLVPERPSCP